MARAWLPCVALGALTVFFAPANVTFAQAPAQSPKPDDPPASATPSTDAKKTEEAPPPAAQPAPPLDPVQAKLLADTAKLVKLTQELKAEIAKGNKDTLSLAVIKKSEEVEKLAKSLKERMNKSQ